MLYNLDGGSTEHTLLFHVCGHHIFLSGKVLILDLLQTKLQMQRLQCLYDKIQRNFVHDKPPHLIGNNQSLFHILTKNIWSGMSSAQVQEILKSSAIVIQNDVEPHFSFGRNLFVEMLGHGDMQFVVDIEGEISCQSQPFIFDRIHIQISLWSRKTGWFRESCSLC